MTILFPRPCLAHKTNKSRTRNNDRMRTRRHGTNLLLLLLWWCRVKCTNSWRFPFVQRFNKTTTATTTSTCKAGNPTKATIQTPVPAPPILHNHHKTEDDTTMNAKRAAAATTTTTAKEVFKFGARCTCGKVEVAIETLEKAPPVRMVCYCSDCRGYYESLDRLAIEKGLPPSAILDQWGGVDWTAMYPRDITILKGKDNLKTTAIRPSSSIRQVYASCCHTPMFRFGGMSVLMNSNLIPNGIQAKLPIEYRIIGRNAWKEEQGGKTEQPLPPAGEVTTSTKKPSMSWSVPFRWFWNMPSRVRPELMQPMPFDVPSVEDVKAGKVEVLKGFQPGSK